MANPEEIEQIYRRIEGTNEPRESVRQRSREEDLCEAYFSRVASRYKEFGVPEEYWEKDRENFRGLLLSNDPKQREFAVSLATGE